MSSAVQHGELCKLADGSPTDMVFAMSLRTERPIQGCELTPYAFMFLKGGTADNLTRQKHMDRHPHSFTFRWSRGPRRQLCQCEQCPRGSTYDPTYWSKAAVGGASLKCAICEKAGVAAHLSLFCSASCFKSAWRAHCAAHHTSLRNGVGSSSGSNGHGIGGKRNVSKSTFIEEDLETDPQAADAVAAAAAALVSEQEAENETWVECSSQKDYVPQGEDVGCILKVVVTAIAATDGRVLAGPMTCYTAPVLAAPRGPPKRHLVASPPPRDSSAVTTGARFRVVSYNILAELYATKQAYPYCDSWSLAWPYRRAMIEQEIEEAQGDVVCLQEVQADHYEQHINPFMQALGYDGIFKQKSRESMGQYGKVDGCATFWRRNKFIMLENYAIEFNDCARDAAAALGLDEGECRRYMNRLSRDNIAQIFVLEVITRPNAAGQTVRPPRQMTNVCVVNTHLYSNHARPDVKLWQSMILMREVEQVAVARDIAVIICGDFNSEPDSAVHEFMSSGCLETAHPELEQSDNLGILPSQEEIGHNMEFASVMEATLGAEPPYTNFTAKFKGTLDYVWFTPGRLRVLAVTNVPDPQDLFAQCGEGLPSASYPSDHIMLCTDIAFSIAGAGTGMVTRPQTHRRHLLTGVGAAKNRLGSAPRPGR